MGTELMRKPRAVVKDPQHCMRVVQSLQTFNTQQSFTDLCFVCAHGLKVYAHKLLICAVSTQLKEMLLQVPDGLGKITVHVPDIDSRILQLLINLLYEGSARLSPIEYELFKDSMDLLGIVLTSSSKKDDYVEKKEDPPPPLPAPPAQAHAQAPQMVYIPSSQGGIQYVLAPSSMVQGSLMSPVVQPSTAAQHLVVTASAAQVQARSQIVQLVQSPGAQMAHFSGQMMQSVNNQMVQPINSQMVLPAGQMAQPVNNQMLHPASQMLRNIDSQMVLPAGQIAQPVNNQMVHQASQMLRPINSQMVQSAGQMVQSMNSQMLHPSGQMLSSQMIQPVGQMLQSVNSQMVQPAGQMVQPVNNLMMQQTATQMVNGAQVIVQNNKQTVINNNHTQVNVNSQIGPDSSTVYKEQLSSQKAGSSSQEFREQSRELVRKRTNKKPVLIRPKPSTTQAPTPPDPSAEKGSEPEMEDILVILQEVGDVKSLTAKEIHDKLKEKLNVDISNSDIENMIKLCLLQEEAPSVSTDSSGTPDCRKKRTRRKRKPYAGSDDEDDEDFVPYKSTKEVKKK